jgi:hypothetical protein
MSDWKFSDPPNVAVIVDRKIVEREDWIGRAYHDADDGAWQFHTSASDPMEESRAMLISLRQATQLDPAIVDLADLPLGWTAWRETKEANWQRAPM